MQDFTATDEKILQKLNARIFGQGERTLMFAHGFGCDQNVWRFVTPGFEEQYQLALFDYVGAGKSDLNAYNPVKYSTLQGYADDVLELRHSIEAENVVFVGHSVSAMIGLLAAVKDPKAFSSIIMVGPSPRYINDDDYVGGFDKVQMDQLMDMMDNNYLGWSATVAPLIMANADTPELAEELTANFCATEPTIARQFARVTFYSDNRKDVRRLAIPAFIMQCSEDIIAPAEVGEYLRKAIPNNEFVRLQATGHCPHMSHPEEVAEAMESFLSKY
jgi:sigma-B regulation protein RsbQ